MQQRKFVSFGEKPTEQVCEVHNSARWVLIFFQARPPCLYGKTTAHRICGA